MRKAFATAPLSLPAGRKVTAAGKNVHAIFLSSREGDSGIRSSLIGLPNGGQKDVDGNRVDHTSVLREQRHQIGKSRGIEAVCRGRASCNAIPPAAGPEYAPVSVQRAFAGPLTFCRYIR